MNQNTDSPTKSSQSLGFGLGITLGSLLGLGAYYLYATKDGAKLRRQFIEEYDKAKLDFTLNTVYPPSSQKSPTSPPPLKLPPKPNISTAPVSVKSTLKRLIDFHPQLPDASKSPAKPKKQRYFTRKSKKS